MRGLWKYIAPFAPDQSGACSVLYGLGGIIVIADAGGCAGNVCGFDEPRWFKEKSAVFSAGLRDMDAIMGRDDKLVGRLCMAAKEINASFAAIIGTPVPAVIGTDYQALCRIAADRLNMTVIAVKTTGMNNYDTGAERAYLELFRAFTSEASAVSKGTIGVIGATPLDMTSFDDTVLQQKLRDKGWTDVIIYGSNGIENIKKAAAAEKNLVVAPAGLKAAEYLQEKFGTPYEVGYPLLSQQWADKNYDFDKKKVLIVHQQVLANELRQKICSHSNANVTVATWFMLKKELKQPKDIELREEDQFIKLADGDAYDIIIGDRLFQRALKHFNGTYIELSHFAVSGGK